MGARLDLTGLVTHKLTVKSLNDRIDDFGNRFWNCVCECGNEVVVMARSLKNGHTKSCGCVRQEVIDAKFQDLTNKEFCYLIALEYVGKYKWLCKCKCGNTCVVQTGHLTSGGTLSCGCIRHNDLTGKIFGLFTCLKYGYYKNDKTYWLCKCVCGTEKYIDIGNLCNGRTKSCGCLNYRKTFNSSSWAGCGEISGTFWTRVIKHAKSRNISFEITIKEAWDKFESQNKLCAMSGQILLFSPGGRNNGCKATASLDRINSHKEYTIDNIWWIHKDINMIKGSLTVEDVLYWSKLIANPTKVINILEIPNIRRNRNWKGYGLISGWYFSATKCNANTRNLEFDIDIKYMWDLFLEQNGRCKFTNLPIFFKGDIHTEQTASLDRIDSSKGYVIDNIQWVHKIVNRMKLSHSDEYFKSICLDIYNYNKEHMDENAS